MTTFEAVITALVRSFSELLPLGGEAISSNLTRLLGWQPTPAPVLAAILLGLSLAVFLAHIHDWASIVSSFLGLLLQRRKPSTFDEWMPIFLLFTSIPFLVGGPLIARELPAGWHSHWAEMGALAVGAFALAFSLPLNRRTKTVFAWNVADAFIVGLFLIACIVPGLGALLLITVAATLRNYQAEGMVKFSVLALFPIFLTQAVLQGTGHATHEDWAQTSSLTLVVAFLVALLGGAIAQSAFKKAALQNGLFRFVIARGILAVGFSVWTYFFAG